MKMFVFIGHKSGIQLSSYRDFKPRGKKGEVFKYMGYTEDKLYPKKLNNGRILKEPVK